MIKMRYRVIRHFADLQDNRYSYQAGDEFPRSGFTVSEDRIAELTGRNNRLGKALIKPVADAVSDRAPDPAPVKTPKSTRRKKQTIEPK